MASGVIYTASWSADKWVDWLAGERRRNELDSLLLLILRYFLWKWERLPQTNPQQDISFGLGIHQSLEAENWSSSQQLNGTPAFFLSSRRKENINCHSLIHDVHHCAVFTFVCSAAKLMSASIFWICFWTMHLPSKQKPPPCWLFWGCLWIFRSWLERTWQRSSALTELAVDHRKWHGGCPSRPLAEWTTQLKADCGGSHGGAFPRPTRTILGWARRAHSPHLELSWPFAPVHWLKMTQCLTRPYDHIVSHARSDITHKRTLTSTVQQMSA